ERLPRAYRERLARAAEPERTALLREWREQERQRRERALLPPPTRLAEFKLPLDAFVRDCLQPLLSPAEAERLNKAEGEWPRYPTPNRHFIPKVEKQLTPAEEEALRNAEGHWPLYPHLLFELAEKHQVTVPGGGVRIHLPGPVDFWNRFRTQAQGSAARP